MCFMIPDRPNNPRSIYVAVCSTVLICNVLMWSSDVELPHFTKCRNPVMLDPKFCGPLGALENLQLLQPPMHGRGQERDEESSGLDDGSCDARSLGSMILASILKTASENLESRVQSRCWRFRVSGRSVRRSGLGC